MNDKHASDEVLSGSAKVGHELSLVCQRNAHKSGIQADYTISGTGKALTPYKARLGGRN